jgi:hypothetical protein
MVAFFRPPLLKEVMELSRAPRFPSPAGPVGGAGAGGGAGVGGGAGAGGGGGGGGRPPEGGEGGCGPADGGGVETAEDRE